MRAERSPLSPFLWLAYVIVPVEGWGLFHGRPLGAFDALALAAFCWLWWMRRTPPLVWLAVAAVVAKIALGFTLLVPRGFDARYYANAEFAGHAETGTESADRSFTRTDTRLGFGGAEDADLPLYFLNDATRFNFYLPKEPARATLPVSVTWEGWLRVARPGLRRVYVHTPGGHAVMSLGDDFSATIPASTTKWLGFVRLKPGLQRIRISLSIPQGGARGFEAGWSLDGRDQPFDGAVVFRRPVTGIRRAVDSMLRTISRAFDAFLCGWLGVGVLSAFAAAWRRLTLFPLVRDVLAIGWVAAAVDALLFARPMLHRMVTLSGGDDWLTYESRARDIGLNSVWMLGGAALGHGRAFFEMPFYPYFLAAAHWMFGDGLYGAFFIQRLLLGGTVLALWRLTAALFGERLGYAGLVAGFVIVYEKVGPWSGVLLTELLFVPLVCLWALQLVTLAKSASPSLRSAAGAGAVGGLATLTRSTLMMGWPVALSLTAICLWPTRRAGRTLVVLVLALMAVISLATVRNWVVARQFVLVNAYGSFSLILANGPPTPIAIPPDHKSIYDRAGLDANTQTVIEYARQSPRPFFDAWRKRAAYALGSFATLAPDAGRSVFYMTVSFIGLLGLGLLIARPSWLPRAGLASLIPLSLALAHFAVLAMTFATVYGDRLLLPFYALLVPFAAVAAYGAHLALCRLAGRSVPLIMWLALFGLCAWQQAGGVPRLDIPVMALAVLLWSVCVYAVPRMPASTPVLYGALIIGLCIWAGVRGTADAEHAARMDALFLAAASCSGAIAGGMSTLRVPAMPAWLYAASTVLALAALHVFGASAPVMTMTGLALGAVGSLPLPSARPRLQPS